MYDFLNNFSPKLIFWILANLEPRTVAHAVNGAVAEELWIVDAGG